MYPNTSERDPLPTKAANRRLRMRLRAELLKRDPVCMWCNKPLYDTGHSRNSMPTLEHIQPLSHGGTWHTHNLALACKGCNK